MALERSPELEQAHHDLMAAYQRRDIDAITSVLSTHEAFAMRGTAPDEVTTARDDAIRLIAESRDDFPNITTTHLEAYADGDLGYIYAEGAFKTDDGTEYPTRGLSIVHREDGQWRHLHGLSAIPVPNDMLTPDSPFAAKAMTAS